MDINVLDGDALLTLAAVSVEGLGQSREGAGEFVRLVQVLAPTFEGLLTDHRAPVALYGGVMTRDRLPDQHSFERIARLHAHHGGERCIDLALIGNGILAPLSSDNLTNEIEVEIVVVGAADPPKMRQRLRRRRVLDHRAGLLGRRRRSFLLSFAASLRSRSRA